MKDLIVEMRDFAVAIDLARIVYKENDTIAGVNIIEHCGRVAGKFLQKGNWIGAAVAMAQYVPAFDYHTNLEWDFVNQDIAEAIHSLNCVDPDYDYVNFSPKEISNNMLAAKVEWQNLMDLVSRVDFDSLDYKEIIDEIKWFEENLDPSFHLI